MAEEIKWTPDLSVGIGEIDTQHREFISIMQQLAGNIQEYDDIKIDVTISFLEEYAIKHFNLEQTYMMVYSYPGMQEHINAHEEFKDEIAGLRKKSSSKKITADHINTELKNYFFNHIKTIDMQLATFLIKKMKK